MDLKEIKSIIDLMTKNGLSEFELEKADFKIRVKRGASGEPGSILVSSPMHQPLSVLTAPVGTVPPAAVQTAAGGAPSAETPQPANDKTYIVSPMVGTFYLAPSPDSEPYVKVGQEVTPDTVVCIIEAMKVMNEIKAEVQGIITEILAPNGKPVEFGKPLFAIKPN